jgi:hypothetical protein
MEQPMQIAAPNQDISAIKMYVLINREKLTLVQARNSGTVTQFIHTVSTIISIKII